MAHSAIVIGTGFGGAVAACRLAQAGVAVKVLERGRRYDGEKQGYPRSVGDDWLWAEGRGLFDVRLVSEMQMVQAAGYGGGSLIYANVHLRPPPAAFTSEWPAGYSREALDPYFDLVAYMLDIRPITDSPLGLPTKTQRMADAANALGRGGTFIHPPLAVTFAAEPSQRPNKFGVMQGGCTHCGECVIGCLPRAKNTLDRNYLAIAERKGAEMRTECQVTSIEALAGGYRVHYLDLGKGGVATFEDADHVFVCAGAIHSTELLLRSKRAGLERLSPRLGERYSGNGDFLAFAFDTGSPWEPNKGPTITTALLYDSIAPETRGWFLIEEGGFTRQLAPLVDLIRPTHDWLSVVAAPFAAVSLEAAPIAAASGTEESMLVSDEAAPAMFVAPAPVIVREGPPRPSDIANAFRQKAREMPYESPIPESIGEEAREGNEESFLMPSNDDPRMASTAVFLAMGRDLSNGRIELLPDDQIAVRWDVPSNLSLYSLQERLIQDVASQLRGTYGATPFWRFARVPITVHSLGGCGMGKSSADGVTDDGGEVFGYPNLFVMDGSILPSATGVNPSHTIAAVAERNIERAIRRITGNQAWTPDEREHVHPYDDPLSQVQVPDGGTPPPVKPALGMSFHEDLDGTWGVERSVSCALEITIKDIAEFIADDTHMAIAGGTISIEGLTSGPTEVRGGVWNLLIPRADGAERELRYLLPFRGADGRFYALHGAKVFRPHPGLKLWDESTSFDFQIHEGTDEHGSPIGQGSLRIGLLGIAKLVASIHEFGPYGGLDKGRGLIDFVEFAFGTVAKVSWGSLLP